MLRTITQPAEAIAELQRICDRIQDDHLLHKESTVREILSTVRRQGDRALLQYTAEFDQQPLSLAQLQVSGAELDAAYQQISQDVLAAIRVCHQQIQAFHTQQRPQNRVHFGDQQVVLGQRYTPVDRVGLYTRGTQLPSPSQVLMNAVPAVVAGVAQIIMATPPGPEQQIHPAVLVAAQEVGIDHIYRVGGAQAIAALAYGTDTIPAVDVIAGNGNIYVTLAKKLVYGTVGIDALTGPSELVVIADHTAHPSYIAADLLAQAASDPLAAAILITTDATLATKVILEVNQQWTHYGVLTEKAIAHYGLVIVVDQLMEAATLANQVAPARLTLAIQDPWTLVEQIRHAGVVLMGHHTPPAVIQYLAGPNPNVPTGGTARFGSGPTVDTFMKRMPLIEYSPPALDQHLHQLDALAQLESGLAQSMSIRVRSQEGRWDNLKD
ncbi:histidinol dehydrogenase [Acaryochloris sp. IP29b_bin.148]|uniref:histidinol dehydrogenase n=1 Tax=Acaryochloris sp. IP29b_bin.148 TaxID=2969218 RepID=UPI002608E1F3|nr:histidinol dehydrogenase [Acaryochloris sp. IP29b_bin.148]